VFNFTGAKFGENVLKWDAFNYATKFRVSAVTEISVEIQKKKSYFTV
jgi:hypothetical protein